MVECLRSENLFDAATELQSRPILSQIILEYSDPE